MASVGLIVNPSAARDVRRLTSLARTIDFPERVNIVARILSGLIAGGVTAIRYMPESEGVVERAESVLAAMPGSEGRSAPHAIPVRLPDDGLARDARGTAAAAAEMAAGGVACVITIGGDGTNRAVVAGWPDVVILPLPGGTNNAFATPIDPTAAGLAAARYAAAPDRFAVHLRRAPRLVVSVEDSAPRIALVDVAAVEGGWIGARAVWEAATLVEAVMTKSDPSISGLAGTGGFVHPLDGTANQALRVRFGGDGRTILAPLGPGQLVPLGVRDHEVLAPGQRVCLPSRHDPTRGPLTLAMDGEREITLAPGEAAMVEFGLDGPYVLDAAGLLRSAARDGSGGTAPVTAIGAAGFAT